MLIFIAIVLSLKIKPKKILKRFPTILVKLLFYNWYFILIYVQILLYFYLHMLEIIFSFFKNHSSYLYVIYLIPGN